MFDCHNLVICQWLNFINQNIFIYTTVQKSWATIFWAFGKILYFMNKYKHRKCIQKGLSVKKTTYYMRKHFSDKNKPQQNKMKANLFCCKKSATVKLFRRSVAECQDNLHLIFYKICTNSAWDYQGFKKEIRTAATLTIIFVYFNTLHCML